MMLYFGPLVLVACIVTMEITETKKVLLSKTLVSKNAATLQ